MLSLLTNLNLRSIQMTKSKLDPETEAVDMIMKDLDEEFSFVMKC